MVNIFSSAMHVFLPSIQWDFPGAGGIPLLAGDFQGWRKECEDGHLAATKRQQEWECSEPCFMEFVTMCTTLKTQNMSKYKHWISECHYDLFLRNKRIFKDMIRYTNVWRLLFHSYRVHAAQSRNQAAQFVFQPRELKVCSSQGSWKWCPNASQDGLFVG